MTASAFLDGSLRILERVAETQSDAIREARRLIADAIEADGMAHFFGAGHSHLAVEEALPTAWSCTPPPGSPG